MLGGVVFDEMVVIVIAYELVKFSLVACFGDSWHFLLCGRFVFEGEILFLIDPVSVSRRWDPFL